jgi:hypothetical protein
MQPRPRTIHVCVTFVSLLSMSGAHAAEPYEGRWSEEAAWCKTPRGDEAPTTITAKSIDQFASSCRILSVARKGTEWRIRTSCRDEGQSEKEPRIPNTFTLRLDGDKLSMHDTASASTFNFTRCAP